MKKKTWKLVPGTKHTYELKLLTPGGDGDRIEYDPDNCPCCIGICDCTGKEPIYQR